MKTRSFSGLDFSTPGAEPQYPPDLGLEPVHKDITLALSIRERSARGRVVLTIRANREDERRLVLDAVDFEDVEVADSSGSKLPFQYDGRKLSVLFVDPLKKGETREVAVSYSVVHPVSGLHFSVPDETWPDRPLWAATDHETERARYWLPCVDLPAVRTTLSFHLTAPQEVTILANGFLKKEESHDDGTKTAHWRLDWPCPSYLVCFVAGDLVRADDESVGDRPIAYFAARGRATSEDLMRSFGRTPEIMRWLEKRLGTPFPFPKYFQFALPYFGGAMENISLVSWDDGLVTNAALHSEIGELVDSVNVHEMGHSYFGDAIVIRDFAHAWLKESWATYLQACWLEDQGTEDEFRYQLHRYADAYRQEADDKYQRPIVTRRFASSWDMYDRHLYPGGALRIHMLRRILGDDCFWPAVVDYIKTFAKKTVETDDFRRKLEKHSGRSLVRFFDDWIYGEGYPKLKATFAYDPEKGRGTLTVEQTQTAREEKGPGKEKGAGEGNGAARKLFWFELDVALETSTGWERKRIEVSKARESFLLDMAEKPLQIRLDPDDSLLFKLEMNPGDELLRRALTDGPDIEARILAAQELAKTGKRANLLAVEEAYAKEPFWGVRNEMVVALAGARTTVVPAMLVRLLESEQDVRVLRTIAGKLGSFREPFVAEALRKLLDRKDLTPLLRAEALAALGAQRGDADLKILMRDADSDTWRQLVRNGAMRGLAATHTDEAFELLLSRCRYDGEPGDSALYAVHSLGQIATHVERRNRDRAVERLIDLLSDPRDRIRKTAALALERIGAPEAADPVERMIPTLATQSHPRMMKVVSALRRGEAAKPEVTALAERVEKLEERNRKLEERLDRFEKEEENRSSE